MNFGKLLRGNFESQSVGLKSTADNFITMSCYKTGL